MKVAPLAITCSLVTGVALAQEPTTGLSLHEAIAIALERNPTLEKSAAELGLSDARVLEVAGIDDLVVDVTSTLATGEATPDTVRLETGLTRSLPTGGLVGLRLATDWARPGSIPNEASSSLLLTLSHPLLRDAGTHVARAERRRARDGRDIAHLRLRAAVASLLREVSQAYWEVAYAAAELDIRRSSLALAREQLLVVRANIDVGKQPPSAAAEVDVAIALREEEVLLAEQGLHSRSLYLARVLCMDAPFLTATDRPETELGELDRDAALAMALEHSPDLRAARALRRVATVDVKVTENGLLPRLDVTLAAGPVGSADGPGEALADLAERPRHTAEAGLVFSWPIGGRAARGQAQAAHQTLRRARATEAEITGHIRAGVLAAVSAVRTAKQRETVLTKAIDLAALDLEAEKARFAVGRASNFDVLRRQEELARARLRQVRAKTDYQSALAVLEALTTEIFARHRVTVFGIARPRSGHGGHPRDAISP